MINEMKIYIIKHTLIDKIPTGQTCFLWNMIGSTIYAASSMILSLFVIKIVGAKEGGIFAIALTLSQMLVYIAYFEMRTFQVTDTQNKFSFSEYHATKIILCIIMLICSGIYCMIKQYGLIKLAIILLVCFSRLCDGYADVYESQFQKDGRLDIAGKSLAYRTMLFLGVLFLSLLFLKDLVPALIISNFFAIFGVIIMDILPMKYFHKIECSWKLDIIVQIIKSCFPLFIGVFCWTYIMSSSRIAIDGNMSSEYQAYYQIIFLPVSVISLFAGFVFRPMLPKLAEMYNSKKYLLFLKLFYKGTIGIIAITILCMFGAWILGIPVLSLLSGCNLSDYRFILVFLIFSGGFNAIAFTMYYLLSIMRCVNHILADYILASFLAGLISEQMVIRFGIGGAATSYFLVVFVLCMLFGFSIYYNLIRKVRNTTINEQI